jgi:chitinase
MRRALLLFLPWITLAAPAPPKQVIGYVFAKDAVLNQADIAAEQLTRINYAFSNIENGRIVEGFSHDAENYSVLVSLKARNPALQILTSVGGWTWSGRFSDMTLTKASRAHFIDSVVEFVRKYQLDGLDIDWEYPGMVGNGNPFRPEDKQHYTALLKELRTRFRREGRVLHRPLLLSVATGASSEFLAHTEMRKVSRYVDTVNLMSYDYYEPDSDKITGHHAPLFTSAADPKRVSADASLKAYRAAGVPERKLVLGVPFYGHAWAHVPPTNFGLYQPGAAGVNLPSGYRDLVPLLQPASGYVRHWDEQASVPFLYNPANGTFISYEDPESLVAKCRFVIVHHLAGIMFWDYESDAGSGLLQSIYNALQRGEQRHH